MAVPDAQSLIFIKLTNAFAATPGSSKQYDPTGKSIKDQSPAPAKPAAVKPAASPPSSEKQDSEDNAASRAAAGAVHSQHAF